MPRAAVSRSGLSLLELLIVIAIIGILIALLIPAVQKVREMAAMTECSNRIRQLAIAAANYASQHQGTLPPGYIGPKQNLTADAAVAYGHPEDNQWVGHLPMLLPFLEQGALLQQVQVNFDIDAQAPPWWEPAPTGTGPMPPNYDVAMQTLTIFRCPADFSTPTDFAAGMEQGTVVGLHCFNKGPFVQIRRWVENYDDGAGEPAPWRLATTNYLGSAGGGRGTGSWWAKYEGVYTNRSAVKLNAIPDGTSNTLMYGEISGRADLDATHQRVPNALDISWFGGGSVPAIWGVDHAEWANWHQFSSYHPGGANFAFADGSVRRLSYETSAMSLIEMAGMKDATVVPDD